MTFAILKLRESCGGGVGDGSSRGEGGGGGCGVLEEGERTSMEEESSGFGAESFTSKSKLWELEGGKSIRIDN